jgi:alpha/beta superfamily hydrolase
MSAPLMVGVTRHLVDRDFAVLRFNFRGVGRSTGVHGNGSAEVADVAAAIATADAAYPEIPLSVSGWSFGAATALAWIAASGSRHAYAGIAPPVSSGLTMPLPAPEDLAAGPRTFILGDCDQFVTPEDLERYADSIGATLEILPGSDHFFTFREARVAEIVASALTAPEPAVRPGDDR